MTIEDSLILLSNTKQSIKTAIENKGVAVGSIPFAQYPGKIGDIPTGIDLPEVGEEFAGGYFVGTIRFSDGLFASVISPRSTGEPTVNTRFKTNTTDDPGANDLFDPRVNMAALNSPAHTAANFCRDLTIGGYSDWLLPSPFQFMQTVPEFYMRGWVGGPHDRDLNASLIYWTSYQSPIAASDVIQGRINTATPYFDARMTYTLKTFSQAIGVRAFRLEKLD